MKLHTLATAHGFNQLRNKCVNMFIMGKQHFNSETITTISLGSFL